MYDIMVDLETTGTRGDRHAIIQIAACKFDLATGAVDHNFFNQCLEIPPWRSWDEDTRLWWGKNPTILNGIYNRMRPAGVVMNEFADWAGFGGNRMWAKPVSFEFPFLSGYFADFSVPNPFHYRNAVDVRSYLKGLWYPGECISEKSVPFDGDAHDAIFDVLHQIKWVLRNQSARLDGLGDPV